MATIEQFVQEILNIYLNHGVYIGTANGELTEELTIGKIKQMEINYGYDTKTTLKNIRRDLSFIGTNYESGYDMSKSRAGDCSGQIVGALRRLGVIKSTSDYSAKMFQALCTDVALKDLKPGDLVFNKVRVSAKEGAATHVGVYVGNGEVVESQGRDAGVVKRPTAKGGWVIGGRFPKSWFENSVIPPLTRNLYYIADNRMTGEDVLQCKQQLNEKGYLKKKYVDDIFGKQTDKAVRTFQEKNNLTVDGIVGQITWKALWA